MERRKRTQKQQPCASGGGISAEDPALVQPDSCCCTAALPANSTAPAVTTPTQHLEHTAFLQASVCCGSAHPQLGGPPHSSSGTFLPLQEQRTEAGLRQSKEMVQEEPVSSADTAGSPARRCAQRSAGGTQCTAQHPQMLSSSSSGRRICRHRKEGAGCTRTPQRAEQCFSICFCSAPS